MKIVVVGAGLIGACAALRLAEAGASVTVVDAATPGAGTSGTGPGHVNVSYRGYETYYDVRAAGLEAYRRLAAEHPADFPWFVATGHLAIGSDLGEYASVLRERGHRIDELETEEALRLEPDLVLDPERDRVFFHRDEGFVLARPMLAHLLGAAGRAGATVRTNDPVASLGSAGVELASGTKLPADAVVVCCGRWTNDVLSLAGAEVPLVSPDAAGSLAVGLTVVTRPTLARLARVVTAGPFTLRPDGGGRVMIHSGDHDRLVPTPPPPVAPPDIALDMVHGAAQILRCLDDAAIESASICIRPLPEDGMPVIGWVSTNVYAIVAHAGATLAPALAEYAAAEVVEGAAAELLARYRPGRFARAAPSAA